MPTAVLRAIPEPCPRYGLPYSSDEGKLFATTAVALGGVTEEVGRCAVGRFVGAAFGQGNEVVDGRREWVRNSNCPPYLATAQVTPPSVTFVHLARRDVGDKGVALGGSSAVLAYSLLAVSTLLVASVRAAARRRASPVPGEEGAPADRARAGDPRGFGDDSSCRLQCLRFSAFASRQLRHRRAPELLGPLACGRAVPPTVRRDASPTPFAASVTQSLGSALFSRAVLRSLSSNGFALARSAARLALPGLEHVVLMECESPAA